ncbi:hypothetical protein [Streptomyces mirabilis]|uniref:hypothetical protein n=1 Tax=Streptomyces mirabilis TaxID=68239 RepID=UPI0036B5FE7E
MPADSTRLATTSVYALGIQISALGLTCRSAWTADSAETVAVMSRNVIITPRHIAPSVRSSLRCMACATARGWAGRMSAMVSTSLRFGFGGG